MLCPLLHIEFGFESLNFYIYVARSVTADGISFFISSPYKSSIFIGFGIYGHRIQ